MLGRALVGAAAASTLLVLVACGSERGGGARDGGRLTLAEAAALSRVPLVYAGERVDGLPLTAILGGDRPEGPVSFVYGDCEPDATGGCAPPAEVQVWPAGARSAASYREPGPGAPVPEPTTVRGFPGALFDDGRRLEVFTHDATIVVFADSPERVHAIARALRCAGPPRPAARQERLAC